MLSKVDLSSDGAVARFNHANADRALQRGDRVLDVNGKAGTGKEVAGERARALTVSNASWEVQSQQLSQFGCPIVAVQFCRYL